jgi:hypothetical protein
LDFVDKKSLHYFTSFLWRQTAISLRVWTAFCVLLAFSSAGRLFGSGQGVEINPRDNLSGILLSMKNPALRAIYCRLTELTHFGLVLLH